MKKVSEILRLKNLAIQVRFGMMKQELHIVTIKPVTSASVMRCLWRWPESNAIFAGYTITPEYRGSLSDQSKPKC